MNYQFESIYGYTFFKNLGENSILNNLLHEKFKCINDNAACSYLNNIYRYNIPVGPFTVDVKDYGYKVDHIIDGKKRLYILAYIFIESKYIKPFNVYFDARYNMFTTTKPNKDYPYIYELHEVYDTFKMLKIRNTLTPLMNEENSKEIDDVIGNLQKFNSFWQNVSFKVCYMTFSDKDNNNIYNINKYRSMLNWKFE